MLHVPAYHQTTRCHGRSKGATRCAGSGQSQLVQAAAADCVRALSRSVKNLRLTLCDAGLAEPLVALLAAAEVDVASSACAALCNLVLDFSDFKVDHSALPAPSCSADHLYPFQGV